MTLTDDLKGWSDRSRQRISTITLEPRLEHIGQVVRVGDGVAVVRGLQDARVDELLVFEGGVRGLAVDLEEKTIGCVLLVESGGIPAGSVVRSTGEVARVPVGEGCSAVSSTGSGCRLMAESRSPPRCSRLLSSRRPRSLIARW